MPQITISKAVGKGAIGSLAADIKTVQILLADKKDKSFKKLYQGRIDGKVGPKTVAGICTLQALNGIKEAAGLIRPMSQTMNKLRFGASPSALKQIAAETVGEDGAATPAVKQAANSSATAVKTKSFLPRPQAEALAKLITAMGAKAIPLTHEKTEITDDGRYGVALTISTSALPQSARTPEVMKRIHKAFTDEVRANALWLQPLAGKLRIVSAASFEYLKNLGHPSDDFLERLGLNRSSLTAMELKLVAAAEKQDRER